MPENRDIRNRDITTSKGIPLENMVISEIPAQKAVSIGHLEAEENADKRD